jgi:hypothetical protein
MPTVVKEHIDAKLASTAQTGALGRIALLLGIAVAAALLASFSPPLPSIVPGPEMSFFAP